jgi:hypothetical protein
MFAKFDLSSTKRFSIGRRGWSPAAYLRGRHLAGAVGPRAGDLFLEHALTKGSVSTALALHAVTGSHERSRHRALLIHAALPKERTDYETFQANNAQLLNLVL